MCKVIFTSGDNTTWGTEIQVTFKILSQPNATSKTSEEIQIISEVEIAIDPQSFSSTSDLSTLVPLRKHSNTLQTTTVSDKSRQKVADSSRTLTVSDESSQPPPASLVTLHDSHDTDMDMSGGA